VSPCEIRLSRKALRSNFSALREISGSLAIFPVIKANGYGHGAVLVAKALEDAFDSQALPLFCVAQTVEAVELRKAGIRREILILSSFDKDDFELAIQENFALTLSSSRDLEWLLEKPESVLRKLKVHLKFNTGMNRLGLACSEVHLQDPLLEKTFRSPVQIDGVMSHLARSEENPALLTDGQSKLFDEVAARVRERLSAAGKKPVNWFHLANSASMNRRLSKGLANAGRPGLRLLGVYQDGADRDQNISESASFTPVMTLVSPLRKLFEIGAREGVGYGHRFVSQRNSLIATLAMGYADGLRRRLSSQARSVRAGSFSLMGHRCPIAGTVSMDMVGIDLSDHPQRKLILEKYHRGESVEATWIGGDLRAEEVADSLETISYEIFCGLSHRIKRSLVE
jgi:alanine racemase